jgi:threonine/homoserine/homoserine lactone efflux protein
MIAGFLFGLTVAAAVGPIALLIINTSLRFGLSAGVRSAFGAAVADLLYAIGATVAGVAVVQVIAEHARELRIAASIVLIAVGAFLLWGAFRSGPAAERTPQRDRPFLTTLALTIINPLTLIVFASFVMQSERHATSDVVGVVLGIFLGSLVVQLALAFGGAGLGLFARPGAIRLLNVASGAGIALFGLVGLLAR